MPPPIFPTLQEKNPGQRNQNTEEEQIEMNKYYQRRNKNGAEYEFSSI
jgi:hypothetical protein